MGLCTFCVECCLAYFLSMLYSWNNLTRDPEPDLQFWLFVGF
jgi:hypothetical protein